MKYIIIICFAALFVHTLADTATGPVQLSVTQEKQFFPHEISSYTQHVHVQIKTGAPPPVQNKLPYELFIVLDSSGSMAGEDKWTNAVSAIEQMIKHMNKDDKIHLVHYNSFASVVFENSNDQTAMLNALHKLHPSGGTNLMAGFNEIIPLLKKYSDRSTVKRLFVLSDGQINEGVVDHALLLKEVTFMKKQYDTTICSFGIGFDFDEKLMTNIADYGSGDYFFIKGAESMEKVIGIAYRGFQNLMGTNAYLKVINKYDTQLSDVFGYDLKTDEEQIIPIGSLRYNDMMDVLLETEVKITKELFDKEEIDYMILELWMTNVTDGAQQLVASETVRFSLSRDEVKLKELNELIKKLVDLQKVQRHQDKVTELLKEEKVPEALTLHESVTNDITEISSALVANFDSSAVSDPSVLQYAQVKAKTMMRRANELKEDFHKPNARGASLRYSSGSSSSLNKRFSKSSGDL